MMKSQAKSVRLKAISWFILIFLCLSLFWQLGSIIVFSADVYRGKIRPNRQFDPIGRSADWVQGNDFLQYVYFLRKEVPEDATVILPPSAERFYLNSRGFMQYFLFPRDLVACGSIESIECLDHLQNPSSFVISEGGFPPTNLIESTKEFIPFQNSLGVFIPTR